MHKLTTEEYHNYENSYQGFCTTCQEFTRDCTEPDAENYDCPVCEENTVVGTMTALCLNLFDITP